MPMRRGVHTSSSALATSTVSVPARAGSGEVATGAAAVVGIGANRRAGHRGRRHRGRWWRRLFSCRDARDGSRRAEADDQGGGSDGDETRHSAQRVDGRPGAVPAPLDRPFCPSRAAEASPMSVLASESAASMAGVSMEKWAATTRPSRTVHRWTSAMSNGVPVSTVVPAVRPTWMTSPSAANMRIGRHLRRDGALQPHAERRQPVVSDVLASPRQASDPA